MQRSRFNQNYHQQMEEHAEPFASSSRAQAVSTHPVASAGSSQQKESLVLESQPGTEAEIPSLADDHGGHLPKKTFVTTKDWTLQNLVECAPHFRCIPRVSLQDPNLYKTIDYHEKEGIPLIIEGWQNHHKWPKDMFTLEWLREHGDQNAYARNIHTWTDLKLSLPDLIDRLRASAPFSAPDEKERLYGKDGECPQIWRDWLSKGQVIPSRFLFGAEDDLLQHLPDANKVETLMCYLGVGDTFTPFHKDLCASSGQNLMCYTENSGSSFWFMTRGSAAPKVANYFHQLGQELDLESHVVTVEEFKKAPFDVYIGEQVLGDLVLVPPRSCHQVINHGGITVKTSWSRMTLNGLKTALYHELPIYRRVCRPEIYRVKSNIYHALLHYTARLNNLVAFASTLDHVSSSSRAPSTTDDNDQRVIARKLRELLQLFDDIAIQEYTPIYSRLPHVSQLGSHKDDINCDFCGADVFQSFFECRDCAKGVDPENINRTMNPGDGVVICAACYVEGRTCLCGIMKPTQCRSFKDLLQDRDKAVKALESSRVETDQEYIYLAKHKSRILSLGNLSMNIFHAGCALQQTRCSLKDQSQIRSCRSFSNLPSHSAFGGSVISCSGCHSARCFTHILEMNKLHSAEAILQSRTDPKLQQWHQHHTKSKAIFISSQSQILRDEEEGLRPDMRLRLVYLALNFRTSTAINFSLTKHGWYDEYFQFPSTPITNRPPKLEKLPNVSNINKSTQSASRRSEKQRQSMDYDREPSPLTSIASDHEDGSRPITSSSLVANPNSVPATSGSSNSSGKKVSRVVIDSATKGKRVYVLVPGDGKDHWSARSARRQQEKAPTSPVIRRSKPDGSDATPSARKQPSRSAKQPPSALGKRSRRVVLSSEPEEVAVNLPVDSLIDSPIDSDPITNTPHSETRDGLHRAKRARHNLPPKKSMQSSSRGQRRHSGPSTKGPVRKQPPTHRPRDPLTFVPAIASQSRAQQVGHGIGSSNYTPHASMADVLQRTFDNNAYFPHEHKRSGTTYRPSYLKELNKMDTLRARIDDKDVKIQSYERRHKADEERHRFDEDRHKLDEERHEADQQELRILKESHEAGQKELAKLKIALQSARTLGHFWPHTCGGTQLETMNIEIGSSSHAANISEDSEVLGPGFSSTSGSNVTSGRTHVRRAQYSGPFARPITPRYGRFHHWRAMNTNSINVGSDGSNISSPISDYHRSTNDPTPNPDRPGYPTPSSDESEQRPIQPESPRPESPPPQGGQIDNRTFERSGSPANLPDGEIMFPGRSVEAREKDEDEISMGGSSDFAGYYN